MFKVFEALILSIGLLFTRPVMAQTNAPAFPGAEGFGAGTTGGRGGSVYIINTLSDSTNSGCQPNNSSTTCSIRDCVQASGKRICIFSVGGLITVNSTLSIDNSDITIAGQSAPGGGVTFKLGTSSELFSTHASNVIMRYLSLRPGPGGENHGNQISDNHSELQNIMMDHLSVSWGVDSNIETWYRVVSGTFQNLLVSEGLNCSTHSKGCHSKGIMIGGYADGTGSAPGTQNFSVLDNVMASNQDRNPLMQMCGNAQVINNVTYNPGTTFSHQQLNCVGASSYVNWINNFHKKGPAGDFTDLKIIPKSDNTVCSSGKTYLSGNVGAHGDWTYEFKAPCIQADILTTTPASGPSVSTVSAQDAYNNLLADGGAGNSRAVSCDGNWFNRRDSIDTRVINDIKNGTGKIIDSPADVGGWITPDAGTACADDDHDGLPNAFEQRYFGSVTAAKPNDDPDGDGYTNIEEFLNGTEPTNGQPPTAGPSTQPTASPAPMPGDANGDNIVNATDYASYWLPNFINYNSTGSSVSGGAKVGDFNSDGKVNGVDYVIWLNATSI